ncbi:hypothetical protein Tco_1097183 [Tanacetum coccineum]
MTDAKEMWEAIKSRFGGNDESKKMQKYILKQQFKSFSISNSEGLHKDYDRFQSLLSQLEIHGAGVSTENVNQKFLSTNSTNDVSTAYGVSTSSGHNSQKEGSSSYTDELKYSFFANQFKCPTLGEGCSLMPRNQLDLTRPRLSTLIAITHDTLLESAYQKEIKKAEEDMQGTLDIKQNTIGGDLENRRNLKLCNPGSDTEVASCSKECVESYAKLEKLYDKQREQLSDASIEICSFGSFFLDVINSLSLEYEHEAMNLNLLERGRFIIRTSLTGFPAQSVRCHLTQMH